MEDQIPQQPVDAQPQQPVPEQPAPEAAPVQQEQPMQEAPAQQEQPAQQMEVQPQPQTAAEEPVYGPRRLTFFSLVLKTFAGLGGGIAGTGALLLIFLAASSILQPVLGAQAEVDLMQGEVSPLFMVVLMGMIVATSMISSMCGTLFIAYTERDRYTRISTMMGQVFILNMVIFAFVMPIYLTTSTTRMELTAFAAGLQIILSATGSALIMELIHDHKYALLAVYNTILAVLIAVGINFMLYYISGNATVLLFAAIPIIWALIGFCQSVFTMIYYWIFQTWGSDFLASTASFGTDYGIQDQTEEEEEDLREDVEGADFLS